MEAEKPTATRLLKHVMLLLKEVFLVIESEVQDTSEHVWELASVTLSGVFLA